MYTINYNSNIEKYDEFIRVKELVFCPAVCFYNHTRLIRPKINGLMQNGKDFEEYLTKNIFVAEEGWLWNAEIIYEKLIKAHPDLWNPRLKKLIEIKCRENLEIKSYDIAQAGIYASILGLKKFIIIVGFLDKDKSFVIREKSFETNPQIFERFLQHAHRLHRQISEGKIWDEQWKYCPKYEFECRNCVYKQICENPRFKGSE